MGQVRKGREFWQNLRKGGNSVLKEKKKNQQGGAERTLEGKT